MWVERGHGSREQRVETGVFKSAEQSVLGRGSFEIRLRILFYLIFVLLSLLCLLAPLPLWGEV